jgi:hypothetical protein
MAVTATASALVVGALNWLTGGPRAVANAAEAVSKDERAARERDQVRRLLAARSVSGSQG